jgi:hypothetical protein
MQFEHKLEHARSSAVVIVPKAVVPKLPLGGPSGGVFVRLKASARNSIRKRSVIAKVFPSMISPAL